MPKQLTLKLIPPSPGRTPYWRVRGTYLGRYVDRSAKCRERKVARQVAEQFERDIERGQFAEPGEPTFELAATNYMNAGGDPRPIKRLLLHFGKKPLKEMSQDVIDQAAYTMFPTQTGATRNREVYTPVSAILKHAGVKVSLRRPKGSRGRMLMGWLSPEEADRLLTAADAEDPEFGLMCHFLLYTGLRLSEATRHFLTDGLELKRCFAFIPRTKNGNPRPVHLPMHLVVALANHPRGLDRPGEKVFRFAKSGPLYQRLKRAAEAAKVTLPERQAFHLFRHTYGTWMRRYGGLDARGLVGTGAWDCEQSANRYAHTVASEDAQRSDLLPVVGVVSARNAPLAKKA
jgi:integrase